jgi:PAS domain S-box-containing protein
VASPDTIPFPQNDGRRSQHGSHMLGQSTFATELLEAMEEAVIATDLAGNIVYWNPFAEELYGWSADEVIGRSILEITVPPEAEPAAAEIMALLKSGESWTGEFKVLRKDGSVVVASVTDSPVFDETGTLIAIVGVSHDVSERKQTEAAYQKMREDLESRVQQRTAELNAATENLRQLSARLLQMQDEERRRIARELHDSVGQMLAAISMNSSILERESSKLSPQGANALQENSQLVNQINVEIRTISHLLHPPLLDEAGLGSALRWYVDGFSERSQIKASLELPADFGRLSPELEISIFRIVQECLTNIHRHSESPSAEVRILQHDGEVKLQIKDHGKGIPDGKKSILKSSDGTGVGFRGMRERLRQLGGILDIESDGNGTVVTATLPRR